MKYLYSLLVFLLFLPYQNFGQIADKAVPSFNEQKMEIPILILPEVDLNQLKREDAKQAKSRHKVLRFAQMIELDISPEYDGIWIQESNGDRIWYLKIKSAGAFSLSVLFDHYRLPMGASLFVYSTDRKHVRGSFTYKNNKWNHILPIAPVMGDEIVIEYHEPQDVVFKGELHISSIAHDYKNVFDYLSKGTKGFGDSGSCNINVNCEEDELWQLVKHSVCKILFNGLACSGSLINNTQEDGSPYLLTANHCISDSAAAAAAIFYFNYESVDCENSDGPKDQTIASSALIATAPNEKLDFSLLELLETPPASYKPYYAGWNRDLVDPTSVTSIHHPRADIKKITKSYDGATAADYGDGYKEYSHWWIDEWDEGTTEKGSSGSPLFDQNGRIIGDLSGGDASCTYNFNDYYQQLYHSWQDFPDSSSHLKPWLDPINSEKISMDGFLPFDTIPSQLKASIIDTAIHLSWNEVIDSSRIEAYFVYRNDVRIDTLKGTSYNDTLVFKNVLYTYFVTANYMFPVKYESLASNKVYVNILSPIGIPFVETFENQTFIPDNWYEERSNDTVGWVFKSGGYEGMLDTAFEGAVNAYFYSDQGESSKLVLPKFDLSAITHAKLSFYMQMSGFGSNGHHLRILYKDVDSLKWKTIRILNTSMDPWEKKEVSLPQLSNDYQIAFEGVGGGGFGISIDSVSITEDNKFVLPDFQVSKDTICIYDSIEVSTSLDDSYVLNWDFGNSALPSDTSGKGPFWVKYNSIGIKPVQLIVNGTYLKQDPDVLVVYDKPVDPEFTIVGDDLISSAENGNQWYLEGIPIEGATEQSYTIVEDGNYLLEVKNSFACSAYSESQYLVVNDLEEIRSDENQATWLRIYPNPNKGHFYVQLANNSSESFFYKIFDLAGILIQSGMLDSSEKVQEIDLAESAEGIYFIQVYSDAHSYSSKILLKK